MVAGRTADPSGRCVEPTTTLTGWRQFVDAVPAAFDLLPDAAWAGLTASSRRPCRVTSRSVEVATTTSSEW